MAELRSLALPKESVSEALQWLIQEEKIALEDGNLSLEE